MRAYHTIARNAAPMATARAALRPALPDSEQRAADCPRTIEPIFLDAGDSCVRALRGAVQVGLFLDEIDGRIHGGRSLIALAG